MRQFTTFETNQSVGQSIDLFFADILPDDFHEINQRHDRPAYNKVECLFLFFTPTMTESHILQSDGFSDSLSYFNLLSNAVNQVKLYLWIKDCQRNTWKSAPCT